MKPAVRLDRDSGREVVTGVMVKWGGCKDQTISDLLEIFKAEQMKCLQGDLPPGGRGKSQGLEFEVDGFGCCSSIQPTLGEMLQWSGATSQLTQHVATSLKCMAHIQPKSPSEAPLSNIPLLNPSPACHHAQGHRSSRASLTLSSLLSQLQAFAIFCL